MRPGGRFRATGGGIRIEHLDGPRSGQPPGRARRIFEASTPPAMLRRSDKRVCCVTTVAAVASAPTQLTDTPQRFPNSPLRARRFVALILD